MTMVGGRKTFLKRSFPYLLEDEELIAKRAKALKYVQTAETEVEIVCMIHFTRLRNSNTDNNNFNSVKNYGLGSVES